MRTQTRSSVAIAFVTAATLSLFATSAAQGAGFGGYVDYSNSDGEIDLDFLGDVDHETDRLGFGFIFDTNVARDRLFNYQLQVGYQHGWREYDLGGDIDSDGFTMNHAFGFSPLRTNTVRLWMGPAVRFSLESYDVSGLDTFIDVSGGAGPAVGLNVHMGPKVSAGLLLSYQYMLIGEILEDSGDSESFDGGEHLVTVGISLMFRTASDKY